MNRPDTSPRKRQQAMALPVVLVMLLLITLIGIGAVRTMLSLKGLHVAGHIVVEMCDEDSRQLVELVGEDKVRPAAHPPSRALQRPLTRACPAAAPRRPCRWRRSWHTTCE